VDGNNCVLELAFPLFQQDEIEDGGAG